MVKHGHTKKRRAGRYGKVSLKNRSWVRFDPKPKVHKTLQEHWDPSKSVGVNLTRIGLCDDPNSTNKKNTNQQLAGSSSIQLFDIPDSDVLNGPTRRERFPLTKEDEKYMVHCMSRYGTDYLRMFRDTKINYMQHTQEKLRKLGARYILLQPNQRTIHDIPESLQAIIDNPATVNNQGDDE